MDVEVDRRTFLAAVGAGAIGAMSDEDKAEELEHYLIHKLDDSWWGTSLGSSTPLPAGTAGTWKPA